MQGRIAAVLVSLCLVATPALAQSSQSAREAQHQTGTMKMWAGIALLVIGGAAAATSHASESASIPGVGVIEASATSTSQLVVGLAMGGAGGYLLWSGLKDRREASLPSTTWGVMVGKRNGVFVRHAW